MFWKFDLHTSSHLEALLDKEDVTLIELMDEEDVLQECKAQNRRFCLLLVLAYEQHIHCRSLHFTFHSFLPVLTDASFLIILVL